MTSKVNKAKESHVMSLRMDHEMYEELIELSEKYKVNKSQLLKRAFREWDSIKRHALEENLIIVGKPFFAKLLSLVDSERVKKLGRLTARNLGTKIRFQLAENNTDITIEKFLDFFIEGVGKKSFAWFNRINYKFTEEKNFIIFGNHSLNQNFSLYVMEILQYLIKDFYMYNIDNEESRLSSNSIHLRFKKE
ncbi:MAG: hypothetical protein BAJALOKI3v1_240018 [Promethearchaeota archaeon]|jgi:hypothetical protein|nr:MAG: hypothetical protein BAJALOKI3v1_240018 [Candidatus Lokiarchaeota archaeon]